MTQLKQNRDMMTDCMVMIQGPKSLFWMKISQELFSSVKLMYVFQRELLKLRLRLSELMEVMEILDA